MQSDRGMFWNTKYKISITLKYSTHHYMVCSLPAEPLWMNFGDGSFLKKYHELVHLNKENGFSHLVYALDNGFYTPF